MLDFTLQKFLADEASTLSETIEQQKHKVVIDNNNYYFINPFTSFYLQLEVLRSQLNDQSDDKERLIEMLKKCQTELEHTVCCILIIITIIVYTCTVSLTNIKCGRFNSCRHLKPF